MGLTGDAKKWRVEWFARTDLLVLLTVGVVAIVC